MRQQGRAQGAASARPAGVPRTGGAVRTAPARRTGVAAAPATPSDEATGSSILLALFLGSLLLPVKMHFGDLMFTPTRLFLFIMFIPLFFRLVGGKAGRILPVDWFMFLYCAWIALALVVNHGLERVAFAGSAVIELFGGYLVGRTVVRSGADYRAFFRYFLYFLLFLLPFVISEQFTRRVFINEILGSLFDTYPYVDHEIRMGLSRIQTVFEHPILFGLFCSIAITNFWFLYRDHLSKALSATGFAVFMTFMSLSSAAVIAIMIQLGMIVWEKVTGAKWKLLAGLAVAAYIVVDLLSNRTPAEVLISYGTFNQSTAYNRIHIWNYGILNIQSSPIFGIGLSDWVRPAWISPSFDNFWLLQAMRYGIPALLLLVLGLVFNLRSIFANADLGPADRQCRTGHVTGLVALFFTLATVHVWGPASTVVMCYFGAGVWLAGTGAASEAAEPGAAARDARDPAGGEPARRAVLRPRARGRVRGGGRLARSVDARPSTDAPLPADR